jgi:ATP-dependent RNA helicase DHX29
VFVLVMAKKKKALKPVARGFATISVPKKPVLSEEPQDTAEGAGGTPGTQSSDTPTASATPPQTDQALPEVEALQAIVEKFQDKTEKDIVRNVKVWCPLAG